MDDNVTIETPRLMLMCCDQQMLEALFESESALATLLDIRIPGVWTEFGERAFRWTYNKIKHENADMRWWTYLPILKQERILAGSCGFKGEPRNGVVEIGYEVARDYRGRGLGTEIASALIEFAWQHEPVTAVQAHTLGMENESCRVLRKCGMKKILEIDDPEHEKIWRWEIVKTIQ